MTSATTAHERPGGCCVRLPSTPPLCGGCFPFPASGRDKNPNTQMSTGRVHSHGRTWSSSGRRSTHSISHEDLDFLLGAKNIVVVRGRHCAIHQPSEFRSSESALTGHSTDERLVDVGIGGVGSPSGYMCLAPVPIVVEYPMTLVLPNEPFGDKCCLDVLLLESSRHD